MMAGKLQRDVSGKWLIQLLPKLLELWLFKARSRSLLYQAFLLQDDNGKITEKRTEQTLLKDQWKKVTKIDLMGHWVVIIPMPYMFLFHNFKLCWLLIWNCSEYGKSHDAWTYVCTGTSRNPKQVQLHLDLPYPGYSTAKEKCSEGYCVQR